MFTTTMTTEKLNGVRVSSRAKKTGWNTLIAT